MPAENRVRRSNRLRVLTLDFEGGLEMSAGAARGSEAAGGKRRGGRGEGAGTASEEGERGGEASEREARRARQGE